jgi:hypothetical protein
MAKTTFSSGVTVTSAWLNGAKQIYFDGQDLDWHYDPLGLSSLVTGGPNGLDTRYITLGTNQPNIQSGLLINGTPISGNKVVTGSWNFGYDQTGANAVNPDNVAANAPKSFTTNTKYSAGGSTVASKFAALSDEDIVTKLVVSEQFDAFEIDNGYYYVEIGGVPTGCTNYSIGGTSSNICPTV